MLSRVQWKKHVAAMCPNGTLKSLRLCFQQAFVQERVVRDFCLFKGLKHWGSLYILTPALAWLLPEKYIIFLENIKRNVSPTYTRVTVRVQMEDSIYCFCEAYFICNAMCNHYYKQVVTISPSFLAKGFAFFPLEFVVVLIYTTL